jgi:hypothetical protein
MRRDRRMGGDEESVQRRNDELRGVGSCFAP